MTSIAAQPERCGGRRAAGLVAALAIVAVVLVHACPSVAAPHPLQIGFGDKLFTSEDAAVREMWFRRAAETGASIARVNVHWSAVAPPSPAAGFDPADPSSRGYLWAQTDAAVRGATAHGLQVMLTIYSAPAWAEAPGRPKGAAAGTWKPSATAFAAFGQALARRYSGTFPDPLHPGTPLPSVSHFEVWNEPNLDTYLSPQWRGAKSVGPGLYRGLLNAFYTAVKKIRPAAKVIAGSLAPFGDEPGGTRTRPVLFLRRLLCLKGQDLKRSRCHERAHFDILSDHPIAIGPPIQGALSPLDVTTPNIGRLTRVVRAAVRRATILPRRDKPLWVTEYWYDSSPPDPTGVPVATQARWYQQDLYLFWRQGARVALALQIRDDPPEAGYPFSAQSGAFLLDGAPKPSQTGFSFPLVGRRDGRRTVGVWGISPVAGRVRIEERRRGGWQRVASVPTRGRPRPFLAEVKARGEVQLRASVGGARSLVWTLR